MFVVISAHCNAGGFVMVPPAIFLRDGGRVSGLPADWGLQLDAFEETLAPYVQNGSAVGIFLGDEKICGGVPLSNYTAVLAHLRAAFGAILGSSFGTSLCLTFAQHHDSMAWNLL